MCDTAGRSGLAVGHGIDLSGQSSKRLRQDLALHFDAHSMALTTDGSPRRACKIMQAT